MLVLKILQINYGRSYKVVSENTDILPLVLEDITVDKNIFDAKVDNSVKYNIKASDDIPGIRDIYLELFNEESSSSKSYYGSILQDGTMKVNISDFEKNGIYKVKRISIRDKDENYVYYISSKTTVMMKDIYRDFSNLDIEVINIDAVEPLDIEILELNNNSNEVKSGELVDFDIKIKSNKRVNSIDVYFKREKDKSQYFYAYNSNENEDGIYTLKFTGNRQSDKYLDSGEYTVEQVNISYYDENNIYKYENFYDERCEWIPEDTRTHDFSELDFNCEKPNEDIEKPQILINLWIMGL